MQLYQSGSLDLGTAFPASPRETLEGHLIASNFKASTVILEVVRERNAGMIVMGRTGKGAVVATILGSTVENVAGGAKISALDCETCQG
ncbi:MAG: hypothetical protein CMI17_06830 [Opitutaceae bacterium]|nr:hypothetical protein [Opitutaceae bacterium]